MTAKEGRNWRNFGINGTFVKSSSSRIFMRERFLRHAFSRQWVVGVFITWWPKWPVGRRKSHLTTLTNKKSAEPAGTLNLPWKECIWNFFHLAILSLSPPKRNHNNIQIIVSPSAATIQFKATTASTYSSSWSTPPVAYTGDRREQYEPIAPIHRNFNNMQ